LVPGGVIVDQRTNAACLFVENPAVFATDEVATHFGDPVVPANIARQTACSDRSR